MLKYTQGLRRTLQRNTEGQMLRWKQVPSTPLPPDYIAEDDTKNGD